MNIDQDVAEQSRITGNPSSNSKSESSMQRRVELNCEQLEMARLRRQRELQQLGIELNPNELESQLLLSVQEISDEIRE